MSSSDQRSILPAVVVLATLCLASTASAFTYESAVGEACHETISMTALRLLRAEGGHGAPLPNSGDDETLIEDVTFTLADDMRDIGAVSLLLGVRDNDLKGRSGIDTQDLARVHGDPATQREHCLRKPEHDEPDGSERALRDCQRYILGQFEDAVRFGLDGQGRPDVNKRLELPITLAFSGGVKPALPHFYVRMGQALHALQDSFTHTFRTPDGERVTVVLNWVDEVNEGAIEARDGPIHLRELDRCDDPDELLKQRRVLATAASVALLQAGLAEGLTVEQRLAAANGVLFDYLSFEPGCTADNRWCDAPELGYAEPSCGCAMLAPAPRVPWGLWALLALLPLARRRRGQAQRRTAALVVGVGAVLLAGEVQAQPQASTTASKPEVHAEDPPEPEVMLRNDMQGFGFHAAVAGSFDNGALAFIAAGRYAFDEHWLIGVDAEYNPWFSLDAGRFARGAFNSYATLIYRLPVTETLALRAGAHAGVSVLLFDIVGAPQGSTGPYLGLSLLGLSYRVNEDVYLLFDPADVAVPVPQVDGAPFSYAQYRLTLGLQIGG